MADLKADGAVAIQAKGRRDAHTTVAILVRIRRRLHEFRAGQANDQRTIARYPGDSLALIVQTDERRIGARSDVILRFHGLSVASILSLDSRPCSAIEQGIVH